MLFMVIFTWEPGKTEEVIKRRAAVKDPEGLKVIGEWADLHGGRVFRLVDVDDPKVILAANFPWIDIGWIESAPVMAIEDVMKLLPAR